MRLHLSNVGPIENADLDFGDLTLLVGPQGTGKSVALQLLNAAIDLDPLVTALKLHAYHWSDSRSLLELILGEGMGGALGPTSRLEVDGQAWDLHADANARMSKTKRAEARAFYVPAQRVLTLQDGWPRPFTAYDAGAPFVLKQFSEQLRRLLEEGFDEDRVFPVAGRWRKHVRDEIADAIFHGADVRLDRSRPRKRIVLRPGGGDDLPFLSWSAGQREFMPLMLGLYWLTPTAGATRRQHLQWAILEEPEMGLHPQGINAFTLAMLELLHRGYKVVVSTHSPHLVETLWAVSALRRAGVQQAALGQAIEDLFELPTGADLAHLGASLHDKRLCVYHLGWGERGAVSKDISALDPLADDRDEADWGGLTEFAEGAAAVVAKWTSRVRSSAK